MAVTHFQPLIWESRARAEVNSVSKSRDMFLRYVDIIQASWLGSQTTAWKRAMLGIEHNEVQIRESSHLFFFGGVPPQTPSERRHHIPCPWMSFNRSQMVDIQPLPFYIWRSTAPDSFWKTFLSLEWALNVQKWLIINQKAALGNSEQ